MWSETCFLRMRGRVTGPHNWADLQQLVRRGKLSRIHEISFDKVNWAPASGFEELFSVESQQPEVVHGDVEVAGVTGTIAEGDETIGVEPISPPRKLAATEQAESLEEGSGSHPKGAANISKTDSSPTERIDVPPHAEGVLRRANNLSLACGLSAGVLMLLCLNVPHAKIDGRLIWWWNLLSRSDGALLALSCFYVLLASLGLMVVTPLLRGQPRGWVYVGTSALGFVLLIAMAMSAGGPDASVILPMTVPVFGACLTSVSFYRSLEPQDPSRRAIQATASGILALAALVAVLTSTYYCSKLGSLDGAVPTAVIVALILSLIGHLCGLAAGVLGMIGSKPDFSKTMNIATIVLSIVATSLPGISCLLLGYGLSSMLPEASIIGPFLFAQIVRLLVVGYALILVAAIGLWEILIAHSFRVHVDPGKGDPSSLES